MPICGRPTQPAAFLRIEVGNVAVGCIQFHVHVLGLAEALRKQTRGNQKHQRQRGLHNNQPALQQGAALPARRCAR